MLWFEGQRKLTRTMGAPVMRLDPPLAGANVNDAPPYIEIAERLASPRTPTAIRLFFWRRPGHYLESSQSAFYGNKY
jgi:hypothetical protein